MSELGDVQLRNLRWLAVAQQFFGAIMLLVGAPLFTVPFLSAAVMLFGKDKTGMAALPFAAVFWVIGVVCGAGLSAAGGLMYWLGVRLWRRRKLRVCIGLSYFELCLFPIGTALGVWSLILLRRPTVRVLFEEQSSGDTTNLGSGVVD